ncbi:Dps family protein [Heyndrickxia ginsengihumi]|uniref:Dps family protein n=1 Tax=Heyndrickxia ginsengihumi TaxID=363870 RepID=UPI000470206C|nr:DNA starvation/stationary phase protection protein [Heyndrickxia ginsengihumi]MBE6184196.1 DNA starvation/stationary phase protection protein [Bacillus sp. (in: firmicutes)]
MPNQQQQFVQFLNQELSNFTVMYIKLHRYHWYVQGKHFFSLHELFETMYEEFADNIDQLAERILAIGGRPLATMAKYLDEKTLAEASADNTEEEMIEQLRSDLRLIVSEIREKGIPLGEEIQDSATVDLLNDYVFTFEKHIWMLEAFQNAR